MLNQCNFIGWVQDEPKTTWSGKNKDVPVSKFTLALKRNWTDKAGHRQSEVQYIECSGWRNYALIIKKFVRPGNLVHVTGRLVVDKWQDKQTGEWRKYFHIEVGQLLLDLKPKDWSKKNG